MASALLLVVGAPIVMLLSIGFAAARTATRPEVLFGLSALGAVLSVVIAWAVVRPMVESILALEEAGRALARGEVDVALPSNRGDELGVLAAALGEVVASQRVLARATQRLVAGDLEADVTPRSAKDVHAVAVAALRQLLREFVAETGRLSRTCRLGLRSHREASGRFRGTYAELLQDLTLTMEAVALPLQSAAMVLERMSKRDTGARITGVYQGAFQQLVLAVNAVSASVDADLASVRSSSERIAADSSQLTAGAFVISRCAADQHMTLDELRTNTRRMSGDARDLMHSVVETRSRVRRMREELEQARRTMAQLAGIVSQVARHNTESVSLALSLGDVGQVLREQFDCIESEAQLALEQMKVTGVLSLAQSNSTKWILEGLERMHENGQQFDARAAQVTELSRELTRQSQQLNAVTQSYTLGGIDLYVPPIFDTPRTVAHVTVQVAEPDESAAVAPVGEGVLEVNAPRSGRPPRRKATVLHFPRGSAEDPDRPA